MTSNVGIDLGTTNSAISTFDGEKLKLWKSREQTDVTPSAILFEARGNKYIGQRAYNSAPWREGNAATLFKRRMGSDSVIELPALNLTKTPVECSAEILRELHGYLDEETLDEIDGTIITVPASFDLKQKDATHEAANLANIGNIKLMQEPVAAVLSLQFRQNLDGYFVVYDFGGGTLDVAIAESTNRSVNLLTLGGIPYCGGRDFDVVIFDNIVKPWLLENFDLPENFSSDESSYKPLANRAIWATEKAKIELSSTKESRIVLSEDELKLEDEGGEEIYLDVPLDRKTMDPLIEEQIENSINAVNDTLKNAGLKSDNIENLVFVGGPTMYKPLREKVSTALGIPSVSFDLNPMIAVSEGAAIFAAEQAWDSKELGVKPRRGKISSSGDIKAEFDYEARTANDMAKISFKLEGEFNEKYEYQINCLTSGWTSGKIKISKINKFEIPLSKKGENHFQVLVFNESGTPVSIGTDKITIVRTTALIESIPSSHSLGIEVLDKIGGNQELISIIELGENLPKSGTIPFKATETVKAGTEDSIRFNLWEGEIKEPITDNEFVGCMLITGSNIDDGEISIGAELQCKYKVEDSGRVSLNVSVPSITGNLH